MGVKSDDILKVSLAAAALAGGAGVAYHYVFYLPDRDERIEVAKRAQAQQLVATQAAEKASLVSKARTQQTGYRVCLSSAGAGYSSRWDASCKLNAEAADRLRQTCIDGGTDALWCANQYPSKPSANCTLPTSLANSYDADLKVSNQRCLEEAKNGLAGFDPQ